MASTTLSKSRFKLALDCPTKVFYSLDRRYVNTKDEDEFLQALADGGYQVGELAKRMFTAEDPAAVEVTVRDQDAQVRQTAELLQRENVTIFEGTIRHGNLLVRVDVLVKRGNVVELIEVKAKSWDPVADSLTGQTPRANPITPDWEPYVYDVAFQERVLSRAHPGLRVRPWLMLVDKSRRNRVAGLGLQFPVLGEDRARRVESVTGFDVVLLREPLLVQVDASEAVRIAQTQVRKKKGRPDIVFDSLVDLAAASIARGERLGPYIGTPCKKCEFYCPPKERSDEQRSGWAECMETFLKVEVKRPREQSVFGFYGAAKVDEFLASRRLWMSDLGDGDIEVKTSGDKISPTERQELQWREIADGGTDPELRSEALRVAMSGWQLPLHFIDFETAAPALPFHVGQRPYQSILFQFSHHVVERDGSIRHATECLIVDGEASPSIEVVRRLQSAIGSDGGTVLHWYPHERTILDDVREEIEERAPRDAEDLLSFLGSLGLAKDSGLRMFDLGRLVADQVFLPGTGGSSSMKKFLPAVLQLSQAVRQKYATPVYGTTAMPSHNFKEQVWVVEQDNLSLDPYKLLNPLFKEHEVSEALKRLELAEGDVIANGAAAMIAYSTLQAPELAPADRAQLEDQLKRYCELDTLAMVMVYEALREWVG